ncbi:MAG: ATP-binding protein [Polyangiaceae bacterium]|nr:ATP-binding protein [Polyangiaceae bacterium]
MKLGIRGKLFTVFLSLIAACIGVAYIFMRTQLESGVSARIQKSLVTHAEIVADQVRSVRLAPDDLNSWDALADSIGKMGSVRVTLIRRDGVVVGDSDVARSALSQVENHAQRPEVLDAMQTGQGHAERLSATVREPMAYVAVRVGSDARGNFPSVAQKGNGQATPFTGVVRVSTPLREVEAAISDLRRALGFATALALMLAVLLSSLAAQLASRGIRTLVEAAGRMARGDLDVRIRMSGTDEFAQLSLALDQLAQGLSSTVEQLSEERDRLGAILRGMQEGVLVLDVNGYVTLTNPALREMLLLGQDAIGKMVLEVLRHTELKELLDRAGTATEAVSTVLEVGGLKPRVLLARAARLRTEEGGVFAVFVDVTEMRRLESLRRDFVANVSHELRTPVAAILSATETLEGAPDQDAKARKRFLPIIARNAERLGQLVEDLLELSRIESRELKLNLESIDLAMAVEHAVALFLERAEKRNLTIHQDVEPNKYWVTGDRRALEHVLTNLIDNAVKYSSLGGTIRTHVEVSEGFTKLMVENSGPGIASKHLPRLFERFYRVDAGRSRELGGTGLGLAIVKHMTEAMKGTVSVQSTEGVGTTFTVALRNAPEERTGSSTRIAVAVAPVDAEADVSG